MSQKKLTIKDLLESLVNPAEVEGQLVNNAETWARIGRGDTFEELGLEGDALQSFLKEWTAENSYANI